MRQARWWTVLATAFAALLAFGSTTEAQQATTTAAVRGTVTGPDGAPLGGATVIATNVETGVQRGAMTSDQGRFQIPFLEPGRYTIRAQFIGYRPVEKPGYRLAIGQVEVVDFRLDQTATQLATQEILADADPLIETTKSGTSTRIGQEQIEQLPTNGRNFKDLTLLAPGVVEVGNTGSGGGQSIGGGRTGASNILMDGANNNESFFGGDARGGDRAPFSYSIEAVKEIQVITAGYDVERGSFTGGAVNAVTKNGTNEFKGSVFGYLRDDKVLGTWITGRDYFGRRPVDFQKQQYGFSLGGPIVKNKAHFFFTFDKQVADEPRPIFVGGAGDDGIRAAGIHPDSLANFMNIAKNVYGWDVSGEIGQFSLNTDESAFFGRIDWQLNENHKLTLRDNYTFTNLTQDRVQVSPTSTDLLSNGGSNDDKSNSFVASLASVFGNGLTNELRAQYAFENKPRPSNASPAFGMAMPQVTINNVRSTLSDGSQITTRIIFGADPVLHANNLEQTTFELIDNLRWTRGDHTYKLGGNLLRVGVYNQFWFNSLGSFAFSSMSDFENRVPSSFSRAVPYFGRDQIAVQDFDTYEAAIYAQDEWQVSPKLFLTYGLRYDLSWFPTKSEANPQFANAFPGLSVGDQPIDRNNVSPRFGFAFDPYADGSQIIRGGSGIFYGRAPYVLYGNSLASNGLSQLTLNCTNAAAPVPDFPSYAADPANIPTSCIGGGQAAAGSPAVNVWSPDYEQSYAWKSNLAYDRLIAPEWRVTVEGVYSTVRDNYVVQDDNFNPTPRFFIEGNIPVFVDPSTVSTSNGSVSRSNSRRNNQFDQVYVYRSIGSSETWQGIVQLNGRFRYGSLYANYTYDNTKDNISISCCTLSGLTRAARVNGNPNDFTNQWGPSDFTREHSFVISPRFTLPYGVELSGIVRIFSGRFWTPTYTFDINGDGLSNDRLYVPTTDEIASMRFVGSTPEAVQQQRDALESRIKAVECMSESRGKVVERNTCTHPWQKIVDVRVAKKFATVNNQTVEVVADFFNLLNGLNDKWGRREEVADPDQALLTPRGFDPSTRQFVYQVNEQFGKPTPASIFSSTQFQMQLGLRYNF